MPKPRKPDEGPFETLLREFMAGRMSSKQGNARIRSLMARREKKAFDAGAFKNAIGGYTAKEAWQEYRKETRRK